MNFLKEIETRILIHDGSKGYLLQKMGLKGGECAEYWNLTNPDAVREVYRAYLGAGSDVLQINTFPETRSIWGNSASVIKPMRSITGCHACKRGRGDRAFVSGSIGRRNAFEPWETLPSNMHMKLPFAGKGPGRRRS